MFSKFTHIHLTLQPMSHPISSLVSTPPLVSTPQVTTHSTPHAIIPRVNVSTSHATTPHASTNTSCAIIPRVNTSISGSTSPCANTSGHRVSASRSHTKVFYNYVLCLFIFFQLTDKNISFYCHSGSHS